MYMNYYDKMVSFEDLKGKTLKEVRENKQASDNEAMITFTTTEGDEYQAIHLQDCCENVYLDDICGELDNLVGSELLLAEEATNHNEDGYESTTWTFYKLATANGYVTITFRGSSNGYYSERVDFIKV